MDATERIKELLKQRGWMRESKNYSNNAVGLHTNYLSNQVWQNQPSIIF